jgi:hypothetical protein
MNHINPDNQQEMYKKVASAPVSRFLEELNHMDVKPILFSFDSKSREVDNADGTFHQTESKFKLYRNNKLLGNAIIYCEYHPDKKQNVVGLRFFANETIFGKTQNKWRRCLTMKAISSTTKNALLADIMRHIASTKQSTNFQA